MGLGLPLVRLIVETHGGSIRYVSGNGTGATFEILLPTEEAALQASSPAEVPASTTAR